LDLNLQYCAIQISALYKPTPYLDVVPSQTNECEKVILLYFSLHSPVINNEWPTFHFNYKHKVQMAGDFLPNMKVTRTKQSNFDLNVVFCV
jgi:hypothetical protein